MVSPTITCISCGKSWTVTNSFSMYQQQAVESYPCPRCGAYTLCFQESLSTRFFENPFKTGRKQLVSSPG